MEQRYLRKKGTNIVCIRTPAQAKKPDMEAIDEKTWRECLSRQKADGVVRRRLAQEKKMQDQEVKQGDVVAQGLSPHDVPPDKKPLLNQVPQPVKVEDMTREQLIAECQELKVLFNDEMSDDQLRSEIWVTQESDGTGTGHVAVNTGPPEPEEPLRFAPEDPPPKPIEDMTRKQLFKVCEEYGIKKAGKTVDLVEKCKAAQAKAEAAADPEAAEAAAGG